jgi:acetylglutamate kinase
MFEGLLEAAPYVARYRGKTFVVKAGGACVSESGPRDRLCAQIAVLQRFGIGVVLVHGGGDAISDLTRKLGGEPRQIEGRRITDDIALGAAIMTLNGTVQTALIGELKRAGIGALGLCGADANLIAARRRSPVMINGTLVDFGHVGDVLEVDPTVLRALLAIDVVPVVSPIAADANGAILNVNADTVASEVAVALGATKLVLATSARGILEDAADPASLLDYLSLSELQAEVNAGHIGGGMLPKVRAIERALRGGVPRVHVVDGRSPVALLEEIFTNRGAGTLIVAEKSAPQAAEAPA